MFRNSRDDGQMFMLVIGAGARNGVDANSELASTFWGILAIAIVMIVFVSLFNDYDRRRSPDQVPQPIYAERNFHRVHPFHNSPTP